MCYTWYEVTCIWHPLIKKLLILTQRLFCLLLLIALYFPLTAQVSTTAEKELDGYLETWKNCLAEPEKDCIDLQSIITQSMKANALDTMVVRYAIEFAKIRETAGFWDERTEAFLEIAYQRALATDMPCELVMPQFLLTRHALFTAEPAVTLERAKQGLEIANECGEMKHIAHGQSYLGAAQIELGAYRKALESLLLAEKGYAEIGDSLGLAVVKLDMAVVYSDLKERAKSRELTLEAAMIYKAAGKELNYGIALIDLCSSYLDVGITDSVQKYLPEGERLVEGRHPLAMAYVQQHYGNLYLQLERYPEAIQALEKGNRINETIGDNSLRLINCIYLSQAYLAIQDFQQAFQYAQKGDLISRELGLNNSRLKSLEMLGEAAYQVGAYEQSHAAYKDYIYWNDSLVSVEKRKEIAALEQSFAAEKREAEIARQQQENKLLSEKNRALNTRNLSLVIALLLLGIAAYAFLNRQLLRTEQQRILVKLKAAENDRLQQEVTFKNRELTAQALHIAQKNEMLNDLQKDLDNFQILKGHDPSLNKLSSKLRFEAQINDNWEQFTRQFTEMNPAFYQILGQRHDGLTQSDLRLATLLRMNLGSKEIAHILNISDEAVKKARYRLRKKLGLQTSEKLEGYVMSI